MHRAALQKLEAAGAVYRCYCTRDDVQARGVKTGYDRFCRTRTDAPDAPYALRFAVPDGDVVVHDLLRGEVRTPFEEMQDFVVARSDGSPTFVIANTVDDIDMEITLVMRGTDLLPAAAQNTLLFRALGAEPPQYAHVPLILAPDKQAARCAPRCRWDPYVPRRRLPARGADELPRAARVGVTVRR